MQIKAVQDKNIEIEGVNNTLKEETQQTYEMVNKYTSEISIYSWM